MIQRDPCCRRAGGARRACNTLVLWTIALVAAGWPYSASAIRSTPQATPATPAADAPGDSGAALALSVERIFGKPSLVGPLPAQIRWAGNNRVSYIEDVTDADGVSHSALVTRDVPSGKRRVVCFGDTAAIPADLVGDEKGCFRIGGYRWDSDGERAVFEFRGELFALERKSGRIDRLTRTEGGEKHASFSPDGRRLAYTRDHDLYTLDVETLEESRLTSTGCDTVYNGVLDWVYMEELFTRGDTRSYRWSPDGRRIVFLEIREFPVPEFPLVDWIPTHATWKMQRYPKAGDPNPLVRVGVVSAGGGEVTWIDTDTSDDSYIARLYWLGDSRSVAVEKLNRTQDHLDLLFADAVTGTTDRVLEESDSAWINVNSLKHYSETRRRFVWGSERSGHSHLYLYSVDGSLVRQLTDGDWEVTSLDGADEKRQKIYFTANRDDLLERHLYVVSARGGQPKRITTAAGTHQTSMSRDCRYFIDSFSSEKRPTAVVVYSAGGKRLFEIGDRNTSELRGLERATPEFFSFTSPEGIEYWCSMIRPIDFDPAHRYPVIVYTYGGPHAQVVRRAWSRNHLWHSLMAERGFIVFSLDNRGSFGRGRAWEDAIHRNLGAVELEDQLAGVAYLKSLPYVDADRIGVWGWSYGGYMTLMAMFKAPGVFKAGTAVAPVSDWRLYDSIYTERYMKRPADNPDGYRTASPIHFAGDLRGRLLLMHGDADNNVHAQNSYRLIQTLIREGKDFDLMIFPQKRHGISGTAERVFLYRKMADFFERTLGAGKSAEVSRNAGAERETTLP